MSSNSQNARITEQDKILNINSLNPGLLKAEYAVRGLLAIKAEQLKQQLREGVSLPFKEITNVNVGNPQALQQKPITFFRQVLSLLQYPELLNQLSNPQCPDALKQLFPSDAVTKAKQLHSDFDGSIGAYSTSNGALAIRERVAKFIKERDNFPSDPASIFLTNGASAGIQMVLQTIAQHPNIGVLIPSPQYPLYSATLTLLNVKAVYYQLDEEKDWTLDPKELKRAIDEARKQNIELRALCVINPGNPTGGCLTIEAIQQIIEICQRERLVLLADEVYQTNIYFPEKLPFHSFKKVLKSMGEKYANMELFSFHSVSKGNIGECGKRGGYFECTGIDSQVIQQLYKYASTCLCPNTDGQAMVSLMVDAPKPNEPSYELYRQEITQVYESLKRRGQKLYTAFNQLEGMKCNTPQGAMYLFPRITLPAKAIREAENQKMPPDTFYSIQLLESTGVCIVPGNGFNSQAQPVPGQPESRYFHFRSTFLPPESKFDTFINLMKEFHQNFMKKYK